MNNPIHLHLKLIKGPAAGDLLSFVVRRTADINELIVQLQQALGEADVKIARNELACLARRRGDAQSDYVDGLVVTRTADCAAYFIIADETLVTPDIAEVIVQTGLNSQLILRALKFGPAMLRMLSEQLPSFRERPDPYTELWSHETGLIRPRPLGALISGAN